MCCLQMQLLGNDLHNGDVILCNHPSAGGSHLPDLTVITPVSPLSLSSSLHSSFTTMINACSNLSIVQQVFYKSQSRPVCYVACRGHHADIGGATPGSMPPHSKYLWEEGMAVMSFKLVENGVFQEEGR